MFSSGSPLPILLCFLFIPLFSLFPPFPAFSQVNSISGALVSSAAAEQYLREAEHLMEEGRWEDALAMLERGGDFADVSSDISYLLARARHHGQFPLPRVMEALNRAYETDRWEQYPVSQARLLEAEILIGLRNYAGALRVLDLAEQGPPEDWAFSGPGGGRDRPLRLAGSSAAILRVLALKGLPDLSEFRRSLMSAMNRYPREPRLVEILLSWAAGRRGGSGLIGPLGDRTLFDRTLTDQTFTDQALVDLALRRLPFLLDLSPRLAYLGAPFIPDTEEARRLVSAYRALGKADRESLPISIDLGLIDDGQAVEEFFDAGPQSILDKALILRVRSLLRSREGRDFFDQKLLGYSGLICSDSDGDGRTEEWIRYSDGLILEYHGDADQDGLPELRILFSSGGVPVQGEQALDGERRIHLEWERYPAVLKAELGDLVFTPAPDYFFFAPLRLVPLADDVPGPAWDSGFLCPEANTLEARLTLRTLVFHALSVTRPSREFPGALERIDLERGVPLRSTEILEGKVVALTEFSQGLPRVQRLDLDLDGRMETIRRFREASMNGTNGMNEAEPWRYEKILESVETDRDRDGLYEIEERFLPNGTVIYSWDTDGDGIRDYVETRETGRLDSSALE
jgi:tetratricopeptide (TPR) repeat protein